tara:strand:- start:519 stop:800 length:282 start_codon:yes stop_codon:yes gene_type:complete
MLDGIYAGVPLAAHTPEIHHGETLEIKAGLALRAIRQGRDVSVKRAAEVMEKDPAFVYRMEQGKTAMKLDQIRSFVKPLGADFTDFAEQMGWL